MRKLATLSIGAVIFLQLFSSALAQNGGQTLSSVRNRGVATASQRTTNGVMTARPWFGDAIVRGQLRINNDQFDRLRRNYANSWNRLTQSMSSLPADLTDDQRLLRQQELERAFNEEFARSTQDVFTDPQQRLRFNQLALQLQGPLAFNDPNLRLRLELTDQQLLELGRIGQDWNRQMLALNPSLRNAQNGRTGFSAVSRRTADRIRQVLTPQQWQAWQELTGEPFDFPATVFVPAD
jgi:hypothetical protein